MTSSAKIIADSISKSGKRITTFELEFPRIILAEFNTHRLFSRNAQSTRAVPLKNQLDNLAQRYFVPYPFTKNRPGMVSNEPIDDQMSASRVWKDALNFVSNCVSDLSNLGVAKQHAGRLLEPFSHIKVVCTATEYDNFFWLRRHPDAQPEIQELAEQMWKAREASVPVLLNPGDWHVPYYKKGQWRDSGYIKVVDKEIYPTDDKRSGFTLQESLAISSSCCAQVSYRKLDDSLEKAQDIFRRLVDSKPVHASPFEHQATPMLNTDCTQVGSMDGLYLENGITHQNRNGVYWSGNFCGWIQHRQLIENNTCWEYQG